MSPPVKPKGRIAGTVLVVLGTLFLVDEFLDISVIGSLWPLAIVGVGIYMLLGTRSRSEPRVK